MNIATEVGAMPAKVSLNMSGRDGGVGEAGRAGEPVGGGDVPADGEGDERVPAGAHDVEDHNDEAKRRHDLAEPQPASGAGRAEISTAGRSNIRLATTAPTIPADELGGDQHRCRCVRYGAEGPLDERDDRVEGS
jgi:hypothetical protein